MSTKTQSQGIHQGELPMLKPILQKWIDLNRNLANEFILDRDVPWWYNERPHVSLLAGAIWQGGGWAFQEYGIERQIKQQRGVKYKAGRRDIDFRVADHYFTAEAKQCWPTLGKNRHLAPARVQDCLDTACKEASQFSLSGSWQLGLVFATPRVPVSRRRNGQSAMGVTKRDSKNAESDSGLVLFKR